MILMKHFQVNNPSYGLIVFWVHILFYFCLFVVYHEKLFWNLLFKAPTGG